ncbi:fumarylacetoacetate hydrolase family protein [Natrialba asiatica]|uniref:Fumarylacetoacetate (FAA) hydrolase n=1 Tax=Natrialba asiatica (strain ATCC 700177 / DSM 12278 / JCM 9576 / FERM P-10747 / NBRC 102637 / 172P1) TaxID=29540 RepID=M0B735_NATA1|nr:fumarylacetoacetate hydrolase family protein [Natrialba asiatica]ELZ06063.1 fumarylacetoacetate (FAA) hydrolase [Natrialba asiatica DSM 12278]
MRYQRLSSGDQYRLIAVDSGTAYDLTAVKPRLNGFGDLAATADIAGVSVDEIASDIAADAPTIARDSLVNATLPLVPDEVWAAGVTYEISEEARESESGMPEMYLHAYEADRPEIFFKATPSRTVGPNEAIGIRADSTWDVPEPELGIVLYEGSIVGYTIGNDVSSREIEGENPLYLPQAKTYDRCCSIGPAIVSADSVTDPHELTMSMEISRDGELQYEGETSTGNMARTCDELAEFWRNHDTVPELGVLLTGTSLVPDDGFTLQPDDEVRITIDEIGELSNPVIEV